MSSELESEYMSRFKQIFVSDSVRKSFRDKVEYRKDRRRKEFGHHSILGDDDTDDYEKKIRRQPISHEHVLFNADEGLESDRSGPPNIPLLDLRPTPTPPPRDDDLSPSSGIGTDDLEEATTQTEQHHRPLSTHSKKQQQHVPMRSRATQTSARLLEYVGKVDGSDDVEEEHRRAREPRRIRSDSDHRRIIGDGGIAFVDGKKEFHERRARSRSPFVTYGLGDRERTTDGKRTFNVKATNGKQVYETALRAALRKGYPLPQKSRKISSLNKRVAKLVQQIQHHPQPPRFGLKKSVIFDQF